MHRSRLLMVGLALAAGLALSACQTSTRADVAQAKVTNAAYANETMDWGVSPRSQLLLGGYHAQTPTTVPGARTVTTAELQKLVASDPSLVLVDVLDGSAHAALPQAAWLPDAGHGKSFDDTIQTSLGATLAKLTGGDTKRPVAFYCLSAECWLSYNAALRAAKLGYQNVLWYRGGVNAWKAAGLPTATSERP